MNTLIVKRLLDAACPGVDESRVSVCEGWKDQSQSERKLRKGQAANGRMQKGSNDVVGVTSLAGD